MANRSVFFSAVFRCLIFLFATACSFPEPRTSPPLLVPTTITSSTATTLAPENFPSSPPETEIGLPPVFSFESTIDRDQPFRSLQHFCRPKQALDQVNEALWTVVALQPEQKALKDFGFPPTPSAALSPFIDALNRCGGVSGHLLNLEIVEVAVLAGLSPSLHELQDASCLAASHFSPVVVIDAFGFQNTGTRCAELLSDTVVIAAQGSTPDAGVLLSDAPLNEDLLHETALTVAQWDPSGDAEVMVIAPDQPALADLINRELVEPLRSLGFSLRVVSYACQGGALCSGQAKLAAEAIALHKPTLVLPVLDALSFPPFLRELNLSPVPPPVILSGVGDPLRFIDAALLPPESVVLNFSLPSEMSSTLTPFDALCLRIADQDLDSFNTTQAKAWVKSCAMVRWVARFLDAAGPESTPVERQFAALALGPVDAPGMLPGWFSSDHRGRPETITVTLLPPLAS
ncbi:MAG: hypothetical protein HOM29_00075 [Actinobacteria bacterium]|nr:hypothetical protein [Actinomycetota bacterium]